MLPRVAIVAVPLISMVDIGHAEQQQSAEQGHAIDGARQDGERRRQLAHQHLEIADRHGLPEQHGIVALVGGKAVGAVKEQHRDQVERPAHAKAEKADFKDPQRRHGEERPEKRASTRPTVKARMVAPNSNADEDQRADQEGAAMLDQLAVDKRSERLHRAVSGLAVGRCISATNRSDRVGVESLPNGSSRLRSTPSKIITVWPKRVSS